VAPQARVRPIELTANQLHRFYRGGARIAAFRGLASVDDEAPEDWVASTTVVHGDGEVGLSRLPDGNLLRDAIAADPEAFLGAKHSARFGADPAVLVKLLDAGERLPLHLHPDTEFAQRHLGSRWGKTEAWIILGALPGATVHVGFARDLAEDELEQLVRDQDLDALVAAMNRLPVRSGDSIYVPAGTPHVIGEGSFLLELQEPSDLSLLLEWKPGGEDEAFLGLPLELGLQAVGRAATRPEQLARLRQSRGASYFPPEADEFFRAERLVDGSVVQPSFSVVIVLDGDGALETEHGNAMQVSRGSTVLVPFAAGSVTVRGPCRAVACRPPS
jgi:mannose-6-phosphate isomerase